MAERKQVSSLHLTFKPQYNYSEIGVNNVWFHIGKNTYDTLSNSGLLQDGQEFNQDDATYYLLDFCWWSDKS